MSRAPVAEELRAAAPTARVQESRALKAALAPNGSGLRTADGPTNGADRPVETGDREATRVAPHEAIAAILVVVPAPTSASVRIARRAKARVETRVTRTPASTAMPAIADARRVPIAAPCGVRAPTRASSAPNRE